MDYVELVLNKIPRIKNNEETLNLSDILLPFNTIQGQVYYEQVERILMTIQDTKDEINSFWSMYRNKKNTDSENDENFSYKDCMSIIEGIKENCIDYINSLKISPKTMVYLLALIEKPTHKIYSPLIMQAMFSYKNADFTALINDSKEIMLLLKECDKNTDDYTVQLYDFKYRYDLGGN